MSLKPEDLKGTMLPKISVDHFHPKAGTEEDVVVVAFYFRDQEPANDLNTFIQRGFIDTLDVDVSPSTDEDGNYLLFVELPRNANFPKVFRQLLRDIKNVAGSVDWEVKVFGDETSHRLSDENLFAALKTDPAEYKQHRRAETLSEHTSTLHRIFEGTLVTSVQVTGDRLTIGANGATLSAVIEDSGMHDVVIGRNFLQESAIQLQDTAPETRALARMAGAEHVQVVQFQNCVCVHGHGHSALLKNVEFVY